jgi:Zn-finger nucleic acid-binding protein
MIKCPYCGFEGSFELLKTWKFRSYNVEMSRCPKCDGIFNYYKSATTEFVIRIKPRVRRVKKVESQKSQIL